MRAEQIEGCLPNANHIDALPFGRPVKADQKYAAIGFHSVRNAKCELAADLDGYDGYGEQLALSGMTRKRFLSTVWREYGTPLIASTGSGTLDGETIAVKDLYAIKGQLIGAGNEAWLEQSEQQTTTAPTVAALLSAGAAVAGIARCGEFAYSSVGNGHYGIPPNPMAPDRIPGGPRRAQPVPLPSPDPGRLQLLRR
jgi:hypothetical protein